jgi:hypothetical protein
MLPASSRPPVPQVWSVLPARRFSLVAPTRPVSKVTLARQAWPAEPPGQVVPVRATQRTVPAEQLQQVVPGPRVQTDSPGAPTPQTPEAYSVSTDLTPPESKACPSPLTAEPTLSPARTSLVAVVQRSMALIVAILVAFAHIPRRRSSLTGRQRGHASADFLRYDSAETCSARSMPGPGSRNTASWAIAVSGYFELKCVKAASST